MGRSRGARRQPLSDLSPVHLLQNTKSPETLEGAAAFLCCFDLNLFFNTKWRHYTPPVGKLRSKKSSPTTSLGNWEKQYSWSSYQNKDTKTLHCWLGLNNIILLNNFLPCKETLIASQKVHTSTFFFLKQEQVGLWLSWSDIQRSQSWTRLTIQWTSTVVGLVSKPSADAKIPPPKSTKMFLHLSGWFVCLFVFVLLSALWALWTIQAFSSNTAAVSCKWKPDVLR